MNNRFVKIAVTFIVALTLMLPSTAHVFADEGNSNNDEVINEKLGVPIVVYGDTLSESQKEETRKLLNIKNPENTEEFTVTGQDIANYIDGDPNSRMFSSAKITREEKGKGIDVKIVTKDNITQVTNEMYENALLTAGVEDATVEVASAVKVTGHSALTGIYKAYDVSGEKLDKERMEVANEELDVTTELADKEGMDDESVTELMTEIKKQIADKDPATKEEVEQIVKEQLDKLDIQLSDKDRQLLINLFDKMRDLNIDFGKIKTQLNDLTSKVKNKMDELGLDEGFWTKVVNVLKTFFQALADFFRGIIG